MKQHSIRLVSFFFAMALFQNVYASDLEHVTMDVVDIHAESADDVMHQMEIPDDDKLNHDADHSKDIHDKNEVEDAGHEKHESREVADDSREEMEDSKEESEDSREEAEDSKEDAREEASEVELEEPEEPEEPEDSSDS